MVTLKGIFTFTFLNFRWDRAPNGNLTEAKLDTGSFERAIDMFRTVVSIVATPRSNVPDELSLVWISQYAPSRSVYVPFYVVGETPTPYSKGSYSKYDPTVAYWNFAAASNWAARFYEHAVPEIQTTQQNLETKFANEITKLESDVTKLLKSKDHSKSEAIQKLSEFTNNAGNEAVHTFNELLPHLITTYHDGYKAEGLDQPDIVMNRLFYPEWLYLYLFHSNYFRWLKQVGYFNSKPNVGPDVILFGADPVEDDASVLSVIVTAIVFGGVAMVAGVTLANRRYGTRAEYSVINI